MLDMIYLAFLTDSTRVVTFQVFKEFTNEKYSDIGVTDGHHGITHHNLDPVKLDKTAKIDEFHVKQLAYFLERLHKTPEGEGTMLDNTLVLYGSGLSFDSQHDNAHRLDNLPILIAGGRSMNMRLGEHIQYKDPVMTDNLHFTLLRQLGVNITQFKHSRGVMKELIA